MIRPTTLTMIFGMAFLLIVLNVDDANAWRSSLYDNDWTPPESQSSPPSFETDKLIQDFSYAGYRRSEVELPEVTGPIFDVVDSFGADPSGQNFSTSQIQDAIDAAEDAGGGVVYLPPGTYRVRPPDNAPASLRIRSSNIVLRGAGTSQTFIVNDEWEMRQKSIIRVDAPGEGWAQVPSGSPVTDITTDLTSPTLEIPVESVNDFSPGDWIAVRADTTDEFHAEHNMGDVWTGQTLGGGIIFMRQVLSIDETNNILTIDVPIRYYLKTRDSARVHLAGSHIEEVGLEDFSIGNVEHPDHDSSTGWDRSDHSVPGTHAFDVHGSDALRLARVRNSWIQNVHTFRPQENTRNAHVLSNAVLLRNSVAITIRDSRFQRALYGGAGGNGYMVRWTGAQEILVQDTTVGYNRHGMVFSLPQTSGNVIHRGRAQYTRWQGIGGNPGGSGNDHHMWLSQSNLVDGTQLVDDYFAAFYRHDIGSNHGHTAVHSVFWNLEGLQYFQGADYIINTQQSRYGYVIGTRGAATSVSTSGLSRFSDEAYRTNPPDHVEGVGLGDTLEPLSLFDDQLYQRLTSEQPTGRVETPTISPHGGTYYEPRVVQLSTDTPEATIHYTLNGSAPTSDSPIYDQPLLLDDDVNLRAVAFADGFSESRISAANFRFPDQTCFSSTDSWENTPISQQDEVFEFLMEATPQHASMNAVMGLADGDASRYQDLAVIARFSPSGNIDARDGGTYQAVASYPFDAETTYDFRFVVDVPNRTYDLFVSPDGDNNEVVIASDFAFRTEQSTLFQLNRFAGFADTGENQICDLSLPCTDCKAESGWVEAGSYSCCSDEELCVCEDMEYHNYFCDDLECTFEVTDMDVNVTDCALCDDGDNCTLSYCDVPAGVCSHDSFCSGTDDDCGCQEQCTDCTLQNGWVDVGSPYPCCENDQSCICQDIEYLQYSCDGTQCVSAVTAQGQDQMECSGCDDGNSCTESYCDSSSGQCNHEDHCAGTDDDCGCESGQCMDCSAQSGWVDSGSAYSCCQGDQSCTCQDRVFYEYSCDGTTCESQQTDEDTQVTGCSGCDDGNSCTESYCESSSGQCHHEDYCAGTDDDCGCESGQCVDCSAQSGWVDSGSAYSCCQGNQSCTCQDRVFYEYSCDGTTCVSQQTDEDTQMTDCSTCDDGIDCTESYCDSASGQCHHEDYDYCLDDDDEDDERDEDDEDERDDDSDDTGPQSGADAGHSQPTDDSSVTHEGSRCSATQGTPDEVLLILSMVGLLLLRRRQRK